MPAPGFIDEPETQPRVSQPIPPLLSYICTMYIEVEASQAAFQLEVQRLDSMDPSEVKNFHLFNITADPYEETDLSHVS